MQQEVEVGPLAAVRTYGLKREAIAPGAHLVVRANPNRGGLGKVARGMDVTTPDGVVYALTDRGRNSNRAPVVPAVGLAGTWVPSASAFSALVRGAANWPLNDAGRAARAKAQQAPQALGLCEPWPPPVLMSLPEPRAIEAGDDAIVMRFDAEGVATTRTVHLDQAEHPARLEPSLQGHSIGRWDGKTLVIDIETDSVAASLANLRSRGLTVADPEVGVSKARVVRVEDPDGVRVEVMEIGPDSRQRQAIEAWK